MSIVLCEVLQLLAFHNIILFIIKGGLPMSKANILLVGCGPHAKRVYIPILKELEIQLDANLKAIVELKEKEADVSQYVKKFFDNIEYLYVDKFDGEYTHTLPEQTQIQLNEIVKRQKINGVIISTDPLNHMQYALWAQKQNLHILMDKPISTYENISNSISQAKQLRLDYELLMKNYNPDKIFIINSQRRFLPQFEIVQNLVNEIAQKYGMPITSMQSTHSDGQWRLPNEILTLKYHPLLGWGKLSHSGYHFIDMASKLVKDSFIYAGKKFDELSVYSKFIRPSGLLKMQSQEDLVKIFGESYNDINNKTDNELLSLYKEKNEAEIDLAALINLSYEGTPLTNITLNLLHNGFSRRSWLLPNTKDLYKGNGRVRHEYHNIEQGCLQNIQIHSYQSSDKHDINTESDFLVGGNNHYDIYIFRNSGIVGGEPFKQITSKEIAEEYLLDKSKIMNELARYEAVKQFIEVIIGKRKINETKGNIIDHSLSVQLMSMIYESAINNSEILQPLGENSKY